MANLLTAFIRQIGRTFANSHSVITAIKTDQHNSRCKPTNQCPSKHVIISEVSFKWLQKWRLLKADIVLRLHKTSWRKDRLCLHWPDGVSKEKKNDRAPGRFRACFGDCSVVLELQKRKPQNTAHRACICRAAAGCLMRVLSQSLHCVCQVKQKIANSLLFAACVDQIFN